MVAGKLLQPARPEQIGAAVSDVPDEGPASGQQKRGQGSAHVREPRVCRLFLPDPAIGERESLLKRKGLRVSVPGTAGGRRAVLVPQQVRDRGSQRLDGDPACRFPALMAADAVGNREQPALFLTRKESSLLLLFFPVSVAPQDSVFI